MKTCRRSGGIAPLILYLGVILSLCYHYDQLPIRGQAFVRGLLQILPWICGYLQHPETGAAVLSRRMYHALITRDPLNMVCWLTCNEILSTKNLNYKLLNMWNAGMNSTVEFKITRRCVF